MKKILFISLFIVSCICLGYPTDDQIISPPGSTKVWDDTNAVWRPLAGTASGTINVSLGTETAGLQEAIASVTNAVNINNASISSKIDVLNASMTQSLTQIEHAASATTQMVNVEGDQTQGSIATTAAMILSESDETQTELATISTALETSIMKVEHAASATELMTHVQTDKILGSIATSSGDLKAELDQLQSENATESSAIVGMVESSGNLTHGSIATMSANFKADATADPTNAFSSMLGISDGTDIKRWFAAIVLGDNANGNNTAAVAPWVWDGVTYDRLRGTASEGLFVSEMPSVLASTSQYTVTDTSQDITALASRHWITIQNKGSDSVWANIGNTPAATTDFEIYAGGQISLEAISYLATISVICDTGKTASCSVVQGVK